MFKRKCKITFIRHGSTILTDGNILNDDKNYPPLNELGRFESERVAKWVLERGLKVDMIYSADTCDCIKTSEIISKALKQDYEVLPDLHPRVAGKWNGLSFDQIMKRYPDDFEKYTKNRPAFAVEGQESINCLNKRVDKIIEQIVKNNVNKRIIVVTNRDIIQSAIRFALEISPEHQTKICINPASATQISFLKDYCLLMYSNYVPFL